MTQFEHVAHGVWDALVVGAGPAGSLAARQLALQGARVLLVDRAPLGRRKVCGCCLNRAALRALEFVGLADLAGKCGAVPLGSLEVAARSCQASIPLSESVSLSREAFDAALARAAIGAGVTYFSETNAALGPDDENSRQVTLTCSGQTLTATARVVLAADGLGCKLLARDRHTHAETEPDSRIGAGAVLTAAPPWIEPGRIYMACSHYGYVGMVILEDGRLNVAAALDRDAVRDAGGPGSLATDILNEVGWHEVTGLRDEQWQGTMALTRTTERLWHERVLVLGDAAGYVEPFTGEGMAWALASAVAIVPIGAKAAHHWEPSLGVAWERTYRATITRRQNTCRILAHALRHPWLVRAAIGLLHYQPGLAKSVLRRLDVE